MKIRLAKITDWIKDLIEDLFDVAEKYADEAVLVTQWIKGKIEENDESLEDLVAKTKTKLDDKGLALAKAKLPEVARRLAEVEGILAGTETDEEAMAAFMDLLKNSSKGARVKFWIRIPAEILLAIVSKKLPGWLAVMLTQKAFGVLFGKAS